MPVIRTFEDMKNLTLDALVPGNRVLMTSFLQDTASVTRKDLVFEDLDDDNGNPVALVGDSTVGDGSVVSN